MSELPSHIEEALTHCSACGRRLRFDVNFRWAGHQPYVPYGIAAPCARWELPPDAQAPAAHQAPGLATDEPSTLVQTESEPPGPGTDVRAEHRLQVRGDRVVCERCGAEFEPPVEFMGDGMGAPPLPPCPGAVSQDGDGEQVLLVLIPRDDNSCAVWRRGVGYLDADEVNVLAARMRGHHPGLTGASCGVPVEDRQDERSEGLNERGVGPSASPGDRGGAGI